MTEQQLARKGAKALLRKLSIDVGTLGIELGPAACEAGVIPLHHVILMLLPEAGVEAFTAREGQKFKNTLQTAHGRWEQEEPARHNSLQMECCTGSAMMLAGQTEKFSGPEKFFPAE